MILYYYKIYSGNLDDILSNISLKGLSDINSAIDNENDIVLANAIFFCIDELAMWEKEDIAYKIWDKLSPLYKKRNYDPRIYDIYNDCFSKDCFNRLFNFVWNKPFSIYENGEGKISLRKLALKKRPYPLRAFNNNMSIMLFFVLFMVLCNWIDVHVLNGHSNMGVEGHSVILSLSVSWIAIIVASIIKNFYIFPVCSMVIMFGIGIYELFYPDIDIELCYNISPVMKNNIALLLAKKNILIGFSYLLWYPIIWINNNRIWDIKGDKRVIWNKDV